MLKRRKQILLRQTETYIRENEIPLNYDPTEEFESESEQMNGISLTNGCINNNHNNYNNELKPPLLTPFENGLVTLPNNESTKCNLPYCQYGCICASIAKTDHEQYETHCRDNGDPECIFGCICHLNDDDGQPNGKRWTALRDTNNKYRQLRWWKDDDDCGFIPPGSQISLAHNEDGRPKRKSQPPERFRHGLDLDKINLDKDFNISNGYSKNNGYSYNNGDNKRVKRIPPTTTLQTNGSKSGRNNTSHTSIAKTGARYQNFKKVTNGPLSSAPTKKKVITKSNSAKSRTVVSIPIKSEATPTVRRRNRRGNQSSKLKRSTKISNNNAPLEASVHNPCSNHTHDYNFNSIITGLPYSLLRQKDSNSNTYDTSDGVLVNQKGIIVAIISWTTDSYSKPAISKIKFKREHIRKVQGKEQTNAEADVSIDVETHDSDLSLLLLPTHGNGNESKLDTISPSTSKSTNYSKGSTLLTAYRFFELPNNYHESTFVIYSELHAIFSSKTLRLKIRNAHNVKDRDVASSSISATQNDSYASGPKILDLNNINLNQPSDPARKGSVYLLLDSKNMIIVGTVPEAYRNKTSATTAANRQRFLNFENKSSSSRSSGC